MDVSTTYFHYFTYGIPKYISSVLSKIRRDVFEAFMREYSPGADDTVLDVGVSADDHESANYLEKHYPYISNITAVSNSSFPELESQFPGLRFVQADGRDLPFPNDSFDFVHSHAVIEHVGSRKLQKIFIEELLRVARKGVMITTPNRWHPIETHTGLPLVHYLPNAVYRRIFTALGKQMYATEDTLNLLSIQDMRELVKGLRQAEKAKIATVRWLGCSSNIVVFIDKHEGGLKAR